MTKYQVEITNGVVNKFMEIKKDGSWVTNEKTALQMAESKINRAWTIIDIKEIKEA